MTDHEEILIVDNIPIIQRSLLMDILVPEGFHVQFANNGELALRSVASNPPHLILLNINIPGMDGFEVCRRLKTQEESREIPVLFISDLPGLEEKVNGFGLGAVDFISKPFQREELLARVRTHLELSRLRTKLEDQVAERTAQLRKSAEEMENLYNNAPCGYHSLNEKGIFLRINHTELKWLGYTRDELIGEKKFSDLIAPENLPTFQENFSCLKTEGFVGALELEIIRKDGTTFPVLLNASVIYDSPGHYLMIRSTMFDISERKRKEDELKQSFNKLHKVLGGIIQAMALTVESRDPYTAGHQRRVSNLARSIGQEMGLIKDQVEAIRTAGMVHDLGMISIPLEILSNPAQLSSLEFGLIRVHPQIGYNILKDIDFPWPIAKIVYQHHERINGSGYPLGLKDGEILPEAKVLMVADAVEAIASHRPYRPAQGIDVALKKISTNGGIIYDPEVVNTCLSLFKEKEFKLE